MFICFFLLNKLVSIPSLKQPSLYYTWRPTRLSGTRFSHFARKVRTLQIYFKLLNKLLKCIKLSINYTRKLSNKIKFLSYFYQIFVKEKHHIHSASHPRLLPGNWCQCGFDDVTHHPLNNKNIQRTVSYVHVYIHIFNANLICELSIIFLLIFVRLSHTTIADAVTVIR